MRIFLIDDEPGVTDNLALYIERQYHTVETLSWVENEELFRGHLERFNPQGVVLDFDMVPSGHEIYGWIREWNPKIPIVFYTKYARSLEHQKKMIEAGATLAHIIQKQEAGSDFPILLQALRGTR